MRILLLLACSVAWTLACESLTPIDPQCAGGSCPADAGTVQADAGNGSGGAGGDGGGSAGVGGSAGGTGGGSAGGMGGSDAGAGGGAGSGGGGAAGSGGTGGTGGSGLRLELTAPATVTVDTGNECFPLDVRAVDVGTNQPVGQPGQTVQLLLINDAGIPLPASFCDPGARWPDGGTSTNFLFRPSYFGALGLRLTLASGLSGFTRLTVRSACSSTLVQGPSMACAAVLITPTIPPAEPVRCTLAGTPGTGSCDAGCLLPAATAMATASYAGTGPVTVSAPFLDACTTP